MKFFELTIFEMLFYFLIYSFAGWVLEVSFQGFKKGIIVNRGFLNGPVCPIYGFGVIGMFIMVNAIQSSTPNAKMEDMNVIAVFLFGTVIATLIELIGGFILDKIFHARWWDYSELPLNLKGYICLRFSLIWGAIIVLVVKYLHPFLAQKTEMNIDPDQIAALMGLLYVGYMADIIVSVSVLIGLNRRLAEIDELSRKMRIISDELSQLIGEGAVETGQVVSEGKEQARIAREEIIKAVHNKREDILSAIVQQRHFGAGRLLRAFPDTRHYDYNEAMNELLARIKNDYKNLK